MPNDDGKGGQGPGTGTTDGKQPAGAGGDGGKGNGDGGQGSAGDPFDEDRARRTIEHLRGFEKQSKQQARELDELRGKLKTLEDERLSESEKIVRERDELKGQNEALGRQLRELTAKSTLVAAAARAGAVDPDLVWRAVDVDALEYDEKGQPKDPEKAVEALREKHPILFGETPGGGGRPPAGDGGARGSGKGPADMNALIRQAAGRR